MQRGMRSRTEQDGADSTKPIQRIGVGWAWLDLGDGGSEGCLLLRSLLNFDEPFQEHVGFVGLS